MKDTPPDDWPVSYPYSNSGGMIYVPQNPGEDRHVHILVNH